MNNPWKHLPQVAPFLLPEDAAKVTAFNKRCKPDNKIYTELPPEPYAGRKDAPVVLLMRRPSYHPDDAKYMIKDAAFAAIMQRVRAFEELENPFYHLNKKYPENPGFHYWKERLKKPIQDMGLRACSQGFLVLQLFPYKTNADLKGKDVLPSFAFTKEILHEAIRRNAIIIQMIAKKEWQQHVPDLKRHRRYFKCKSPANPTISPRNIGVEEYEQVIAAIRGNIQV